MGIEGSCWPRTIRRGVRSQLLLARAILTSKHGFETIGQPLDGYIRHAGANFDAVLQGVLPSVLGQHRMYVCRVNDGAALGAKIDTSPLPQATSSTRTPVGISAASTIMRASAGRSRGRTSAHLTSVLPFENFGGDKTTGRLADGITEDIITDLARFRDLDVMARNSTAVYKGRPVDVRQAGEDLGVDYVLAGSIQRQTNRVRVTAQLVDARSGSHAWSERWDRPWGTSSRCRARSRSR